MIRTFSNTFGCLVVALTVSQSLKAESLHVAVLDSPDKDNWSVGLADFVEAGLQKEGVATYDRSFVRVWLGERESSHPGIMDLKTVSNAKLPAVDLFVRAEVLPVATNQFSLTLEAVRASDAVVAISLKTDGRYPQEWLASLEKLTHEMASRLRDMQLAENKTPPGRAITWMPEASLWFFRGMDCYAKSDYAQAVVAFGRARRWERHFRPAWLWEARSYQRLGFAAQAQRVLEAGHLLDQPVGRAWQHPVLAVVAGNGVTADEKQVFTDALAASGMVSVLDPRWIGASAREVDLQLTGEMSARTEAGNAWLVLDQVVVLERTDLTVGKTGFRARKQDVLSGQVEWQAEATASTNVLNELAQRCLAQTKPADGANAAALKSATGDVPRISLPLNPAEAVLSRCLDRAQQNPSDVRALLTAADACLAWESDVQSVDGRQERGVEWRVRDEFLTQAIEAIRRSPSQKDASFLLASIEWRQRYTPEYGIWAGSFSGTPLREQMRLLLELFPHSPDATNLSETITENVVHNRRSLPTDPRYLQPVYPPEPAVTTSPEPQNEPPGAEEKWETFISMVYQKQFDSAATLYPQLALAHVRLPIHEENIFLNEVLQTDLVSDDFIRKLELLIQSPDVPAQTRYLAAYNLAVRYAKHDDYFRATELLRNLVADEDSAKVITSWTARSSNSIRDQAYDLLKHVRLFGDSEVDFNQCCGPVQMLPPPAPAIMSALDQLFQERLNLAMSFGPPSAEKLERTHQEMNRVEKAMLDQYRDALPAFLNQKIQASGPGPESMGLCAQLGSRSLPLLPQIVAAVGQQDNQSTQCNALNALSNMGKPAAGALPVVILALEDGDSLMVHDAARLALKRLGTAPAGAVPYLARLLYHPDPEVAAHAADAVFAAAGLPPDFRQGMSQDESIERLQRWWENTGSWKPWNQ